MALLVDCGCPLRVALLALMLVAGACAGAGGDADAATGRSPAGATTGKGRPRCLPGGSSRYPLEGSIRARWASAAPLRAGTGTKTGAEVLVIGATRLRESGWSLPINDLDLNDRDEVFVRTLCWPPQQHDSIMHSDSRQIAS